MARHSVDRLELAKVAGCETNSVKVCSVVSV